MTGESDGCGIQAPVVSDNFMDSIPTNQGNNNASYSPGQPVGRLSDPEADAFFAGNSNAASNYEGFEPKERLGELGHFSHSGNVMESSAQQFEVEVVGDKG